MSPKTYNGLTITIGLLNLIAFICALAVNSLLGMLAVVIITGLCILGVNKLKERMDKGEMRNYEL